MYNAKDARWFDVAGLPKLAFDHKLVVREAFKVLANKVAAGVVWCGMVWYDEPHLTGSPTLIINILSTT